MYRYGEDINVLLIEDNQGDARLIFETLKSVEHINISIDHIKYLKEGINTLGKKKYDIVLLDLALPDSHGLDTFYSLKRAYNNIPVIVLTGHDDELNAIKAVKAGAQDYLPKNQFLEGILVRSIFYAIERHRLLMKLQNKALMDDLTGVFNRRGFFRQSEDLFLKEENLGQEYILIYVDLDKLKHINDSYGHDAGDDAIIHTATILKETFRVQI